MIDLKQTEEGFDQQMTHDGHTNVREKKVLRVDRVTGDIEIK
jgi:hypothetical protein